MDSENNINNKECSEKEIKIQYDKESEMVTNDHHEDEKNVEEIPQSNTTTSKEIIDKEVMNGEIIENAAMDEIIIEKEVMNEEIIENPAMAEEMIEKEIMNEEIIENPAMDEEIIEKDVTDKINTDDFTFVEKISQSNSTINDRIENPAMDEEIIEKDKEIMNEQIIQTEKMNTNDSTFSKPHDSVQQSTIGLGLNMIAQYDSDAEDTNKTESLPYRNQVVNVNSDTDSDTSSDDSICSENTEKKFSLKNAQKTLEKMLSDSDDDEDDNDTKCSKQRRQPKVKGELLLDDLPPIEDLHITVPEDECIVLGKVHSIVDQLALVSALPNSILVDLDTVLFLNKGKQVLGAVFDVLGQVSEPLYCIRFNSNEQIKEKNINVGDIVYVAPKTEYTQFIILSNLLKVRGSDASWENDVEPPPRYLDYSDDEEERKARARARNKDRRPESENSVEQKRAAEDNESNASYDTRPAHQSTHYRRQNPRGAGTSRGRGRGMHHAYNQHYAFPNTGSWHSNYYQAPPPPPPHMFYGAPPQMRPIMPYQHPPRFQYNTLPAPPGTSHNNNNNM